MKQHYSKLFNMLKTPKGTVEFVCHGVLNVLLIDNLIVFVESIINI